MFDPGSSGNRLTLKFLIPVLGLLLLMQVTVGLIILRNESVTQTQSQAALGAEYAKTLSIVAAPAMADNREDELQNLADQLKNRAPKVSYVGFFDTNQALVADCRTQPNPDHQVFTAAIKKDGRSIGEVRLSKDPESAQTAVDQMRTTLITASLLALLLMAFAVHWVFRRVVLRPLAELSSAVSKVAQGDLGIEVSYHANDEIGALADNFRSMAGKLQEVLNHFAKNAQFLSTNAGSLHQVGGDLTGQLQSLGEWTDTVTESTQELTGSMTETSNQMEVSAMETQQIAASVGEIRNAVNAMAESAEKARGVTRELVDIVNRATTGTQHLTDAAGEISSVTNVINDIADQTKLLALNATIEAARAGDLGRGFGVVANEVKELARQTNSAIEEISGKIEIMQTTAAATADEMTRIKSVMGDVDEIVAIIASAVVQQTATVQSISDTVSGIANGINQVSATVSESAQISQNMSFDIKQVRKATEEVADAGIRIRESGQALNNMAEELTKTMGHFNLGLDG